LGVSFNARAAIQRTRNEEFDRQGYSVIRDQGVAFDSQGRPYERPAASGRDGVSHGRRRRSRRRRRGAGDDDSSSSSSSDESGRGPRSRDGSESSEGRSRSRPKPWPGDHWQEYAKGRGPRRTQYLSDVHAKYHRIIDEQVGTASAFGASLNKTVRFPSPPQYAGKEDIEVFENWLQSLLRWMKLNQLAGPELDQDRVSVAAMYLSAQASTWFNDNVESASRRRRHWTFKRVVTGLYDRFIHESSIQDATHKFYAVKYATDGGVLGFYNDLERYAARMVHPPDNYTFKSQLLMGLPASILRAVVEKGATAETTSLKRIVRYAQRQEEAAKVQRLYESRKRPVAGATVPYRPRAVASSNIRVLVGPRQLASAPVAGVVTRPASRPPARPAGAGQRRPVGTRPMRPRDAGRDGAGAKRQPAPVAKAPDKVNVRCFGCDQVGHYATDPVCPNFGKPQRRLAAIYDMDDVDKAPEVFAVGDGEELRPVAEVIADDEQGAHETEGHDDDVPRQEEEPPDSDPDGGVGPYEGSQYAPQDEGNVERYEEFDDGYDDDGVRLNVIRSRQWAQDAPEAVGINVLQASKFPKPRPAPPRDITRPLTVKLKLNDLDALALIDSGSTADAVSPEFARVAKMKAFSLEPPVEIKLGCKGSRSAIIHGAHGRLRYASIDEQHYWDVVNIDRWDVILGIGAMRKFKIVIDPATDSVFVAGKRAPTLSEGEERCEWERRSTIRRSETKRD